MIEGRQNISRKQMKENKATAPKGYKKGYACRTVLQQCLRGNASKEEQQNVVYFFLIFSNRFINNLLKYRLKFFIFFCIAF